MIEVAETHTGLVFLVGERAYKVKKPIATDFLDFTDVAARERACATEVRLNRRLAPDSYLGVGHFAGSVHYAPHDSNLQRHAYASYSPLDSAGEPDQVDFRP